MMHVLIYNLKNKYYIFFKPMQANAVANIDGSHCRTNLLYDKSPRRWRPKDKR